MKTFLADKNGFYGNFGGTFIPESLKPCIDELQAKYLDIITDPTFKKEYDALLRDYVGRPSPLYLSKSLSERCNCKVYLKREDLNHTGAHKINNTIGQILLAKRMGKTRIIAETGAGQHGVATATVCALMGMECHIYMGKLDVERQHVNVQRMEMLGATVHAATSGSMTLKEAVDEAIMAWAANPDELYYLIGSTVGPHPYPDMVSRLQSVISEEIKKQLIEKEGRDYPDYLVACIGGGSNASGTIYHYVDDLRANIILAEAGGKGADTEETAASITVGTEGIIHGFRTLVMFDDKGEVKEPYSISAGLDYPGIGPLHAHIAKEKRATVFAITDDEALEAAFELTEKEGIIPALESAHALAALNKVNFKPTDIVVVTLSGRGDKDIDTYLKERSRFNENKKEAKN